MFNAIARFSVKFRWFIIAAWFIAAPLLMFNLPKLGDVTSTDNSDFLPKDNPSMQAIDLETMFSGKRAGNNLYVVAAATNGKLSTTDTAALARIATDLRANKNVTGVQDLGTSADLKAQQLSVSLNNNVNGPNAASAIDTIRNTVHKNLPPGLEVHLAGQIADAVDSQSANQHGKDNTQLYTVIFILVLLLFVFRALLAPIVTLIPAALALVIAQPLIAESTKIGVQVSFITEILLVVLILGAGTDYGLFLVFRVREELRNGLSPKEAVVKALSKVGESISFSALTVAAALMSLVLAKFGLYKGLGPALAIGLGVMLLAALTFLPALLSILGRAVFWPAKTQKVQQKIGLWGRVADTVIKRPWLMLLLGVIVFGGLSLGMFGYKITGFSSSGAPANTDAAKGRAVLTQHFPATSNNPQLALFKMQGSVWNNLHAVEQAQKSLVDSGKFSQVYGPFSVNGYSFTPQQLQQLHQKGNSSALKILSQFISPDGKTFQLFVVGNKGKSGSTDSVANIPTLRQTVTNTANTIGAEKSGLLSDDAFSYDINKLTNSDLLHVIPIVLLIIGVLLGILLRSFVAPWYLIITVALSFLATLGFAMLVFVKFGSEDGINFVLPFMLFIFSMALGEDYNILVMSRIREEAHDDISLKDSVTKAVGITGTTVTSAGMILAGTFGVLGLMGGNIQVEEIGFSIAFGILLDTFFVRTLLVPSIVTLLGKWNWWPSKLYREHV